MTALFILSYSGNSYAIPTGECPVDNWMNMLTSETYTYQQYVDNPIQNIAGDSIALNLQALAVVSDGLVKVGDQIRLTLTNGASFAAHPSYPGATPAFVLEEDLGGAGTGNLIIASLVEASPLGGNTLTFNLDPTKFSGAPLTFTAPPDPCDYLNNYFSSSGFILSGANIAGQASNFAFSGKPWDQQDVTLKIDYLRGGSRLFGGERVLFSASDWVANQAPTASSVTLSGTAKEGEQLSGSYTYADTESDTEGTSTFRWVRNSVNTGVSGGSNVGSSQNYTAISADVNNYLYFCVTPVATTGTSPGTEVCSSASSQVAANAAPTASSVSLSGTAKVGNQLSGSYTYGDGESDAEGVSTFRWVRNGLNTGVSGGTDVATTQSYTLVSADTTHYLYFCVIPVAATGTSPGTEACSTAAGPITGTGTVTLPSGQGNAEAVTYSYTSTVASTLSVVATTTTPPTPTEAIPANSLTGAVDISSTSSPLTNGYSIVLTFTIAPTSSNVFTGFWKYGIELNTETSPADDHWYDFGTLASHVGGPYAGTGYEILDGGKTLKVYMTDNIRGDDVLTGEDGEIVDAALPIVAAAAATSIPTLSIWSLLLLTSLIGAFGFKARNKK